MKLAPFAIVLYILLRAFPTHTVKLICRRYAYQSHQCYQNAIQLMSLTENPYLTLQSILELGGGTGVTTADVLRNLTRPDGQTLYSQYVDSVILDPLSTSIVARSLRRRLRKQVTILHRDKETQPSILAEELETRGTKSRSAQWIKYHRALKISSHSWTLTINT